MDPAPSSFSRRDLFRTTMAASAAGLVGTSTSAAVDPDDLQQRASKGRLKQSIVHWCYKDTFDVPQLAEYAKQLGCRRRLQIQCFPCPRSRQDGFTKDPARCPVRIWL